MPNRVLKESIRRSPQINSLTCFEEVVFYRLIATADDYGCVDGRISLLRCDLFPLKDTLNRGSLEKAVARLADVGLVKRYTVDGIPYLYLTTWEKHQRIRNKRPKYPLPPDLALTDDCPSNDGHLSASRPPESESESRSESQSESESRSGGGGISQGPRERRPLQAAAAGTRLDALQEYAWSELEHLSRDNMEELLGFRALLPDELIRHGINEACASGRRNFSYLRAILNRYAQRGFKTVEDLRSAENMRRSGLPVYASEDDFY